MTVIYEITKRPRRNRKSAAIRSFIEETRLAPADFVAPLFAVEGQKERQAIPSLPGVHRLSLDLLAREAHELFELGIPAVNLFIVVDQENKDAVGSEAIRRGNLLQQAVDRIKQKVPDLCVMVDIALDPFTDHGHDGVVNEDGYVVNDSTLQILAEMALLAAEAGADMVSPSDMMDGRIGFIRQTLDREGYQQVGILAYAAKYASALYGPFRDVLNSNLKFGDKKSYQLNPANSREAMREIALDEEEGADMLLIKPATLYLDIIAKARACTNLPLGAYHVSGEYAMVMAAAKNGWLDADRVLTESMLSIKRAGADFIITYAARRMVEMI